MVEVFGFVLAPALLLFYAVRNESVMLVRAGAIWAILGIMLNRANVSMIAFNWNQPDRYVPSWMEIAITITIITVGLLTFRFIVRRMPVLYKHPAYVSDLEH